MAGFEVTPEVDHELLNVAKAEAEPEIPPDAHDDDLRFEMASLEQRWPVPSHPAQAYQTTSTAFATLPFDLLMGYVVAHEVGHCLLGPGHSYAGLMRGEWNRKDAIEISRLSLHLTNTRAGKPPPG